MGNSSPHLSCFHLFPIFSQKFAIFDMSVFHILGNTRQMQEMRQSGYHSANTCYSHIVRCFVLPVNALLILVSAGQIW